jgi:competence protein ComEC
MGIFHYLNVNDGDCTVIEHPSGNVTVMDVCNASSDLTADESLMLKKTLEELSGVKGNFNQKEYPVNPIAYLKRRGINSVFRFILSHPEMDHMDGIRDFFAEFSPINFWDTYNTATKDFTGSNRYDESDWLFYKSLRDGKLSSGPKRLVLHAGDSGKYWNESDTGKGGDGLYILAPTPPLVAGANAAETFNDASYVVLYRSNAGRILMPGDSHDATWEHILANHRDEVANVDLLIAPHHGRDSERSYDFLDVVRPKLTFFGNANSEHLAYDAWYNRGLPIITNNQANSMIVDTNGSRMEVYVTNKSFAERRNPGNATYSAAHGGYYVGYIAPFPAAAVVA